MSIVERCVRVERWWGFGPRASGDETDAFLLYETWHSDSMAALASAEACIIMSGVLWIQVPWLILMQESLQP
jgi:hypothetical protein